MISKRAAVLAVIAAASAAPAAGESAWMMVGQRQISGEADRETIEVRGTYVAREVMVCVDRSPVRMLDVDVRFRDGQNQAAQLRTRIRAGACSRTVAIRGRNRELAAVSFSYDPASLAGATAQIQVLSR